MGAPHTHFEARPTTGGPGPSGTVDTRSINPSTGQPYSSAFGIGAAGRTMNDGTGNISNFGDARPQTTGTHMGTDFAAPVGTPIYSNIEGTVTRVTTDGNYGLRVEVTAADGTKYQLAHLDATDVTVGQKIGSGDFVAFAGGSGNANATNGPRVPGYEPKGGTVGDAGSPAPGNPYDTTIPASAPDGYTYGGYDEGGKFYTSADGNTSVQYDPATKSWTAYDANTGDVLADQSAAANLAPDPSNLPGQAPASAGGAGAGAGGAAAGPAAAALGGAGCLGGGPTIPGLTGAGGLLGNLGGVAQGALISGAMAALSGGGIQGVMGAMLGSAGGALGNALGASLGGSLGAIVGQSLGGALGGIVAGQSPLQALSGAAFGAISQMGASLIPGLSNVMPAGLAQAAVQGLAGGLGALASGAPPGAAAQYALAGGLQGAISGYVNNMTGNYTLGSITGALASGALTGQLRNLYTNSSLAGNTTLRFANNIAMVAAVSSNNRLMVGAISEALSQSFGATGTGGYGARTRNMQDAMTFSVTTLGQNVGAISADMISMGDWDSSNLMRLMQPGNVTTQILMRGLGGYTGITDLLTAFNVPLAGIDNPLFDSVTQQILNSINDPEVINTIRSAFRMTTTMSNLGELTSLEKMMPRCIQFLPVHNFRELGVQLAIIGVMGQTSISKIGQAFSKLETATDLNYFAQNTSPLPPNVANQLMQVYGYGGGTFGEQTMADFIGTAAGYVHSDTAPVIAATNKFITSHPSAEMLTTLSVLMNNTISGVYTDLGTAGSEDGSIPAEAGEIVVPFPAPTGSQTFSTLDDAMLAFIPLIEAEHVKLLADPDPLLQDNLKKLEVAYNASCAQLIRESNNLLSHNIDLFSPLPPVPAGATMFTQALEGWALQTGYGSPSEYVERVATKDIYGDCMKYIMRQSRNAQALMDLGINIEQYRLPQSQYYRDPEGFYENMYTGKFPPRPANQVAYVLPRTPTDVYLNARNQKMQDMGYGDTPLLNNQKDELFYDSTWMDTDQSVLEDIGRQAVKTALDRNVQVTGNDLLIVNLDGSTTSFGQIKDNGLVLTNNEYFTKALLDIVNRLLYGDLKTTKYSNPFNTDQMVYGVLEMLAQVTKQNIDALMQTVTGGLIANGLLNKLLEQFGNARSLYDTKPERNEPAAWGGVGPDAKLR